MSATQELIAAALIAADKIEGMELPVGYLDLAEEAAELATDLREACARAMVQPDIAEVERLVDEYSDSVVEMARERKNKYLVAQRDTDRTALIDAVRAIVAERDGLMQTLRDEIDENLRLRELGGALPDENITAMTERIIRERGQFRAAAKMVQPVGEVPMPEPAAYLADNGLWCNEPMSPRYEPAYFSGEMQKYGDAREAAGYAAGGKDAERYRWLRDAKPYSAASGSLCELWLFSRPTATAGEFDAAIDAALRGEVKP